MSKRIDHEPIFLYDQQPYPIPMGYTSVFLDLHDAVSARQLAWAYAQAGLSTLRTAAASHELPQLAFPALFLVRHAFELFVKGMVPDDPNAKRRTHRLDQKLGELRDRLATEHAQESIDTLVGMISHFQRLDPVSMEFRYKDGAQDIGENGEFTFVDLVALLRFLPKAFAFLEIQWAKYESRDSQIAAMQVEDESLDFNFSDIQLDSGSEGDM